MRKIADNILGAFFAVAAAVFTVVFLTNDDFFNWAFARHHNVLSWYIRPLFIVPIVFFAFRKSLTGIFASIFALLTSMFWFPAPETSDPLVLKFLAYEMEYLKGAWDVPKIVMTMTVPIFFIALITAAWKRNLKILIGVVAAAAVLKVIWSVVFGGEAGMSIIKPAITGLVICIASIYAYKRYRSANKAKRIDSTDSTDK